jgi:hypothetical protein
MNFYNYPGFASVYFYICSLPTELVELSNISCENQRDCYKPTVSARRLLYFLESHVKENAIPSRWLCHNETTPFRVGGCVIMKRVDYYTRLGALWTL